MGGGGGLGGRGRWRSEAATSNGMQGHLRVVTQRVTNSLDLWGERGAESGTRRIIRFHIRPEGRLSSKKTIRFVLLRTRGIRIGLCCRMYGCVMYCNGGICQIVSKYSSTFIWRTNTGLGDYFVWRLRLNTRRCAEVLWTTPMK